MTSEERLVADQARLVEYFFQNFEAGEVKKFTDLVCKVRERSGVVYFSGMGKSGIISQNITQLLVSIGIKASFLSPVDALHGDVGVLSRNDVLVLLSRSGQTGELVNLVPAVRAKEVQLVSVTSNREGKLNQMADVLIYLPLERELCPFDLCPTTSSVVQLIFGNIVVARMIELLGLTKNEYALNHPAGRIGKRLTVRVRDLMKSRERLPVVAGEILLQDCLTQMTESQTGCLLVGGEEGRLRGILTDGDLRRAIERFGRDTFGMSVEELMTADPVVIDQGEMAIDAMDLMENQDGSGKKRVKELPVVSPDGKLVGLVLLHDLVVAGL